jgi:tRNA (cmo5U34)-methyltransferase
MEGPDMSNSSLGHTPSGQRWKFDSSVTTVFDDMLRRSIPQYEVMRHAVTALAMRYVKPNTDVLDLGCSLGETLAPLVERFGADCRYLGVEVSGPMLDAARSRFRPLIDAGSVQILDLDLRAGFPRVSASVILSVLTIQFTPIEHRLRILEDIHASLLTGGAFIFVEKVIGATAPLDRDFVELYYEFKRSSGYTREEIERKRLSLEGVLVPVTAGWNEELLKTVGFRQVDCFWRWMNFAGWIAVRS